MIKLWSIFNIITICLLAQASNEELANKLSNSSVTEPLINEKVSFTAIKDHHFNLEAPQECGMDATADKTARQVTCQFHSWGTKKVTVSVCDDAKKYCKQEYHKIVVQKQTSKTPRMKAPLSAETVKMQKEAKSLLMKGFHNYTPKEAQEKMRADGTKGLFVMVSTEWCPPCNMVKEFVFPTQSFQNMVADYTLIYVDGDKAEKMAWMPYLNSHYYPSFIVLNKDMQAVNLKAGYMPLYKVKEWLGSTEENWADTVAVLETRMNERLNPGWVRWLKDWFNSSASKAADLKHWVSYLDDRGEYQESLKYMQALGAESFKEEIIVAEYMSVWLGKSDLEPEEQEKQKNRLAKRVLNETTANPWPYGYIVRTECSVKPDSAQSEVAKKTPLFSEAECEGFWRSLVATMEKDNKEQWDQMTPVERLINEAQTAKSLAGMLEAQGQQDKAKEAWQECVTKVDQWKGFTPLKEKSRSSRIEQSKCLAKLDEGRNIELLKELAADYPYESTFHGKLAKHYKKKKQYQQALTNIETALRYAYGDNWAKSVLQKVEILKAMGREQQALNTVELTLKNVSLNKDSKRQWWLKSLRAHQKTLKKTL